MKQYILIAFSIMMVPISALAQQYGIAAVVNDDVISTLDVQERADFLLKTTDLGQQATSRDAIKQEVLRMLVDEALKASEAKRFSIAVSDNEVEQGIRSLEASRGKEPGSLKSFLRANNIAEATFRKQIQSDILWNKFVAKRLRKSVNLSDDEVYMTQRQVAQENRGTNNAEIVIKQIVLSLKPDAEFEEVDILMDIAREVARFPGDCLDQGVAGVQDFADTDINVEFVRTTYRNISPQVRPIVESLGVTDISEPFATPDGIHLLMLCERIDLPPVLPPEEQVRMALFQEKLELEAEKHLRKLRRDALIDIKI